MRCWTRSTVSIAPEGRARDTVDRPTNASSIDSHSISGLSQRRISSTSSDAAKYAWNAPSRNTPSGQRTDASARGMPERTPHFRASRDAAATTPRLPGRPPTMTGRPASSGRRARSTATKNESRSTWRITSVHWAGPFRLPGDAGRFGEHAHVLLERRNQIGYDLQREHDLRTHRRLHLMVGFGRLDVLLRERLYLTKRKREVERRMGNGAEVRVRPRRISRIVGHDGEVDLLAVSHRPSVGRTFRSGNLNSAASRR